MVKPQTKKQNRRPGRALLLLTQPTFIVIVTVIILIQWRIPTRIDIDLNINRAELATRTTPTPSLLQTIPVRKGKINYPDYPHLDPVAFVFPERIEFQPADKFQVEEIEPDSNQAELRFRLVGVAEKCIIRSSGGLKDCRLTRFDTLRHARTTIFVGVLFWATSTAVGWYKLYQELKD